MKKLLYLFLSILFFCSGSTSAQEAIDIKFKFDNVSQEEITDFKKKAEKGDADSQTALGFIYLNGCGLEKDSKKAFLLLHEAALKNHPIASNYLGLMYITGEGVQKNSIEAIKWLKKSADSGNSVANSLLNEHFGQTIKWKVNDNNFRGLLLLKDKHGNSFPNKSVIDGLSKDEILQLNFNENNEVTVILSLENCLTNDNSLCSESYDFALFKPDWSLAAELLNKKPYFMAPKSINGNNILINKIMAIEIDQGDDQGIYKVIVRIHQRDKVLYEFLQMFNVSINSKNAQPMTSSDNKKPINSN